MKKRINELLNGKFTDLQNTLELSKERICARTMENENFFGKFSILSPAEKSIQGFVQSTNPRVGLRPDSFAGIGETIRYEADVKGMEAGEVLKGEFLLNTSAGEYRLPYEITVENRQEERREVQVPFLTPEQFAALAKEDFADTDTAYAGHLILFILFPVIEVSNHMYLRRMRCPYCKIDTFFSFIGCNMCSQLLINIIMCALSK